MTSKSISPQTSQPLGALKSYTTGPSGISGETSFGSFRVSIYTDLICRIGITHQQNFDEFSYSVIAIPEAVNFEVVETNAEITLTTDLFKLLISKNPVRFRFTDLGGEIINEDEPGLGTSWIGEQVTTYKKLQEGERFIGLGEKTGGLDRCGHAYQNWNTDAYAYHGGTDPLYCSTPFYIGIHHRQAYGIFLDNTHKTFFNFGASNNRFASFSADTGEMNYYFISGRSIPEIIKGYTHLTGRMEMPPLWSIGYQQCRYSYYPDKEITALARTFREKDIPSDVIVLDVHYMDKYKIFTWDKKNFPNPKALLDEIKALGFHVVVICDPGIKIEPGYEPYDDGVEKNIFLKYSDGENYAGQVWPGWCHFPDFTNPLARDWWASKFKDYVATGVDGFWNDMNEIATWGNSLPENLVFDFEGNPASTRRGRNIYGFQMARSSYEGAKSLLKGKRPFNLTRSGFSGIQRYAAVWTGDNVAYDEHMILGVRLVSSLGLAGIAFAGYDVGGFVGDANTKLFARWISIGALSPFFRGHSMINSRDAEPWSFGEEVEQIARNYIKFRYQLLPYIYSLFHDASQTGMPVQRSLAIDYPFSHQVFDGQYHNQYLFGPYILVAPVESNKDLVKVYLPAGEWFYLFTGKKYSGEQEIMLECPIHKLPVFIKAGALLPMQAAKSNTREKSGTLNLHLYHGTEDSNFTFYDDDGETFDYQSGKYSERELTFRPAGRKVILGKAKGTYSSAWQKLTVVFHNFEPTSVSINGQTANLMEGDQSFFTPMEKYDPINEPESMGQERVKWTETSYPADQIEISW
jgi:alpha-glucosidase